MNNKLRVFLTSLLIVVGFLAIAKGVFHSIIFPPQGSIFLIEDFLPSQLFGFSMIFGIAFLIEKQLKKALIRGSEIMAVSAIGGTIGFFLGMPISYIFQSGMVKMYFSMGKYLSSIGNCFASPSEMGCSTVFVICFISAAIFIFLANYFTFKYKR